jgi:hypothetical protein
LYAFRIEPMHFHFHRNAVVIELWDYHSSYNISGFTVMGVDTFCKGCPNQEIGRPIQLICLAKGIITYYTNFRYAKKTECGILIYKVMGARPL